MLCNVYVIKCSFSILKYLNSLAEFTDIDTICLVLMQLSLHLINIIMVDKLEIGNRSEYEIITNVYAFRQGQTSLLRRFNKEDAINHSCIILVLTLEFGIT